MRLTSKLFSIFFIIGLAFTPFLISDINEAYAVPAVDVHGISYNEGSSFGLAVYDYTNYSYPVVDWYIYYVGDFDVIIDGVVSSYSSDGLMILTSDYEPGMHYDVSFILGSEIIDFRIDIRKSLNLSGLDVVDIEMMELSVNDYNRHMLTVGLCVALSVFLVVYFNYWYRRRSNRRGVRSI